MLNPNETIQFRRIPMLTRPGRPLEVGWAQEFARWLWHVFVLPAELAKPWPRWMHRYIKPHMLWLGARLGVTNPRSLRAWICRLAFLNPPHGRWSDPTAYLEERRRRSPSLKSLLQHAAAPYVEPIVYWLGSRVESYSAALSGAYIRAHVTVRFAVGTLVVILLVAAMCTPLSVREQFTLMLLTWILTLAVRQLAGYGPGVIMILFSIVASSRYIWWRLTQTTGMSSGFEWFFGMGLLAAES